MPFSYSCDLEQAPKQEEYALRPKQKASTSTDFAPPRNRSLRDHDSLPGPIGHCKAIAVNFGFAKYHNGVCFLRYDDTNPAKDEIFFTSIREVIAWLGFEPYKITYGRDHFDRPYELAEEFIKLDKAYVCHCSHERRSPRERPVEESLMEFRAMRDGKYKAGEAYLRMKQSLTDPNEGNQMWDLPALVEKNHHYRTGDKWKIYPTYDFTHCLCDAFEEISHSMCTTEFQQSRVSYGWLLEMLGFKIPKSEEKGPMQREYGRLNVTGAILSKRRIAMLVEGTTDEKKNSDGMIEKKVIAPTVRSWDDPRLYALVALHRRGIPAKALLNSVEELGVTDALTDIQVLRFEAAIRRHLERTVPRLMLVLDPPIKQITIPYDPKGMIPGERKVGFTRKVYIDSSDFREEDSAEFFRLAPNRTVGLLNVPFAVRATTFSKDSNGHVSDIRAVKVEEEKPKAYIHWVDASSGIKVVARQYNPLFKTGSPNSLDWKEAGWADDLNPNSEVVFKDAVIEKGLEGPIKAHSPYPIHASDDLVRFQALHTGYFCVDPVST
ncbi:uncharacterized protein K441DRAFT_702582 [Cenococcum geophilum 1.58]|uniref:uncharacterized protein n=1 Tax=Cenococcum geophilum 1.58 TaxID=794803 RepID=UPI00358F5824|nr:hypothetical protein K441DRAFT_702582 [Cenococcum geophilum 1.58]